jgi:hypothetical protein
MTQAEDLPASETVTEAPKRRSRMSLDESRDTNGGEAAKPAAEDVQSRLKQTSDRCVACYKAWTSGNEGEGDLNNALHELRRVLARIEIEVAASHADEGAQRAIPIPMHRAHQRES